VAFSGKKTQKLWIWKAYDRTTGHLLDWECGGRDRATLQRLVERLNAWNVTVYFTDHWECYREVMGDAKLVQSKTQTVAIERNNGRQRHWLGRFRRRTVIVSRSREMVDLSVALFAAFHVNHTLPTLKSLFT
jgi:IS1 family transposase